MPRPNRAQGRPGTSVIPKGWEESHAIPVAKTHTAHVVIRAAGSVLEFDDDLNLTPGAQSIQYDGMARIQVLAAQRGRDVLAGEQNLPIVEYRVTIDRGAELVTVDSVVEVAESNDPALADRLAVARVDKGSLRWERVLYCVEDQMRRPEEA